jgi:lipopolysaccharide export system permease protein
VAPRAGAWGNILKAFLIYVVYENLQKISQGLLVTGKIPLLLAYGGAYLVMAALTIALLVRNVGWRWAFQPFWPRKSSP